MKPWLIVDHIVPLCVAMAPGGESLDRCYCMDVYLEMGDILVLY